ncbi:MAG: KH domain-containing protein [Candidatus Pacebacteria bacterium]|nr:KH domain-containing protein [Candidatus Paceibacterota bacterium]MBP9832113.1 KH domain-containing protein [Candidatus Paceibacterota bacterium]
MDNNQDQEFLEYVVKMLVDNPSDVKVNRQVDEMGVLLTMDVNPADMGKVIGRSGNTAKAIRILLRVVGMKNNARVNLKINEPAGGSRPMGTGFMGSSSMGSSGPSSPMSAPSFSAPVDRGEQGAASRSVDEALEDLRL